MRNAITLVILALISLGATGISADAAELEKDAGRAMLRQELIVRIELAKDTVRLGEPLSGKVSFENRSMSNPIEILYPGFNSSRGIGCLATSIDGLRPDGTPRFRCQVDHHFAKTICEVTPTQISGFHKDEEVEQWAEELELHESEPRFAKLDPGRRIVYEFAVTDCREILPRFAVVNGQELPKHTEFRSGSYEISLNYLAHGTLYWAGTLQCRPVAFTLIEGTATK